MSEAKLQPRASTLSELSDEGFNAAVSRRKNGG